MPTLFPAALDDNSTIPTSYVDASTQSVNHPTHHDNLGLAVKAMQAKLGNEASTPTLGKVLTGDTVAGTSIWATPSSGSSTGYTNILTPGTVLRNGSTDDAAAINAIIANPGHYFFPGPGTYLISDSMWVKSSNVTLEFGAGAIVKMANSANQPLVVAASEGGVTILHIRIINGEFDGNAANQTYQLPHTGAGPSLSGHALYHSGVLGLAAWDVQDILVQGGNWHDILDNGINYNHCADTKTLATTVDWAGKVKSLKDVTGAADGATANNYSVTQGPLSNGAIATGHTFIGCTAKNIVDVGFDLHSSGSNEYTVIGCIAKDLAPANNSTFIPGYGYAFEMESADTQNGGFGNITGNVASGLVIGYAILNTANPAYEILNMTLGPNQALNCTEALLIYGRHVTINGFSAYGCTTGVDAGQILPWISATATAGAGTTATFAAATFSAAQQAMLVGQYATITSGTGSGLTAFRRVTACTATQITVTPAWTVNPAASSVLQFSNHGDWTFNGCDFQCNVNGFNAGYFLKASVGIVIDGISINGGTCQGVGSTGTNYNYSGLYTEGNVLNLEINALQAHGFNNGVNINSSQAVKINGGTFHKNNEMGIGIGINTITNFNVGSIIQNARCVDNGVNNSSGYTCGIAVDGAINTLLEGNVCGNSQTGGSQANGISIGHFLSSTTSGTIIKDGDLRGNGTGAIVGTITTATVKQIQGVVGYNDLATSTAPTPSTGAYSITAFRDAMYTILGGTISNISIGGVSVATAAAEVTGKFWVPAGQALLINNTVIPTTFKQILY